MPKRNPGKPEQMPGSPPPPSDGMSDYLVLLKDDEDSAVAGGRHAFYQSGRAHNAAFQERLRKFLKSQGVEDQVTAIGEPTVFPMVALRCTPEVAKLLRTLPEVEDVIRDSPRISVLAGPARPGG